MTTLPSYDNYDLPDLPELLNVPVLSEEYISQKEIDELCKYLWKETPDLIIEMSALEKDDDHRNNYSRYQGRIFKYLREQEIKTQVFVSDIAAIQLMHELSRRLRKALALFEYPIFGNSLASSPNGKLTKILHIEKLDTSLELEQYQINTLCEAIYTDNQELMFLYNEQARRYMSIPYFEHKFTNACDEAYSSTRDQQGKFRKEMRARVEKTAGYHTCDIISFIQSQY